MSRQLTDADISRVAAKVIPCGDTTIRRRFAIECLDIEHNEFRRITYNQRDNCEEVVYECLIRWRNKGEKFGNPTDLSSLIHVFDRIVSEEISKDSYQFLFGPQNSPFEIEAIMTETPKMTMATKRNSQFCILMRSLPATAEKSSEIGSHASRSKQDV